MSSWWQIKLTWKPNIREKDLEKIRKRQYISKIEVVGWGGSGIEYDTKFYFVQLPLTESTSDIWAQKHCSSSKTFTLFVFDQLEFFFSLSPDPVHSHWMLVGNIVYKPSAYRQAQQKMLWCLEENDNIWLPRTRTDENCLDNCDVNNTH